MLVEIRYYPTVDSKPQNIFINPDHIVSVEMGRPEKPFTELILPNGNKLIVDDGALYSLQLSGFKIKIRTSNNEKFETKKVKIPKKKDKRE